MYALNLKVAIVVICALAAAVVHTLNRLSQYRRREPLCGDATSMRKTPPNGMGEVPAGSLGCAADDSTAA
jgi:hypothetical protein